MPSATPSPAPVVLAVDQGTSATKAMLVDETGRIAARASVSLAQRHPQPGWVEQDPLEILESVRSAAAKASDGADIAAIGLSTQRESAMVWERSTGAPLSPVLGWQDRRSAERARELSAAGAGDEVRSITGLPIDPMFSALKLAWILDDIDPDRRRARNGELAIGTVDCWLASQLTGEHRIEAGNASRTQLVDIASGQWSDRLLELFNIPAACLPTIVPSDEVVPSTLGAPVHAVLGDSHAAFYGHGGSQRPGTVKVTYGTGSSVMGLADTVVRGPGLVGTIAWWLRADAAPRRAFEGNVLSTGATLVWLADLLDVTPASLASLAESAESSDGVDIVPAFAGLGAPWWDDRAVGTISGLQLGTHRASLARAAFESIALQIEDVLSAAERELDLDLPVVLADGGPARNDALLRLQADLSGRVIRRHDGADLSALGAGLLAAQSAGLAGAGFAAEHTDFTPDTDDAALAARTARRARWDGAVQRARFTPSTAKEQR